MIRLEAFFAVVTLALVLYCVVDVLTSDEYAVRNLPRLGWLLLVLVFPFVGSVAWLVAGRPRTASRPAPGERAVPAFPEYDRPGRMAASDAAADEEFLRGVRERADEQRRRYREQQRRTREGEGG